MSLSHEYVVYQPAQGSDASRNGYDLVFPRHSVLSAYIFLDVCGTKPHLYISLIVGDGPATAGQ